MKTSTKKPVVKKTVAKKVAAKKVAAKKVAAKKTTATKKSIHVSAEGCQFLSEATTFLAEVFTKRKKSGLVCSRDEYRETIGLIAMLTPTLNAFTEYK